MLNGLFSAVERLKILFEKIGLKVLFRILVLKKRKIFTLESMKKVFFKSCIRIKKNTI